MPNFITIADLLEKETSITVYQGEDFLDRKITVSDLYRPALELTGYFRFYPKERLQLFGKTEISYIQTLEKERRIEIIEALCQKETPAFLISRDLEPPEELLAACKKNNIVILSSQRSTTHLYSRVTSTLERALADRKAMHGVLVDINGMGVLITGKSGIGKSETALDLIKRGHRLVADDRVDLYTTDNVSIYGSAPEITKYMIEIRGIGVIDVIDMFGVSAVRGETRVDINVHLELWEDHKDFDRLGGTLQTKDIFKVKLPQLIIPVSPGRNLGSIIETAAMSVRAKNLGYDAAEKLMNNMDDLMKENEKLDAEKMKEKKKKEQ